ncbi:ABC transporter permease [Mediterraneibacter massiliensis]|uniref:ABC transporter permease n=1 Tax=Mediterraneibacter massiliensis TaxID=1720300 RepID=UPI00073E5F46|nr:ABC transporter permease [Mediterraneibacter massiliensis]
MNRKALRKDFYMEIRRSLGRFLSIFFIVAIGVAFFSGIRAAEPDMRISGDTYFDEKNLMDIQVVSTLGLTEDDVEALRETEGIEKVEGGYSVDALCTGNETESVVHISSILPTMNQVTVEKGRLPKTAQECAVDVDFLVEEGFQIGDTITLRSGTDTKITDTLKEDTFTIVGAISSPCYISFQRGSTTIGTGNVDGFVSVPAESFDMEVYTELYVAAEGAKALTAFTAAYDDCVEAVTEHIEGIKEEREDARYQEIIDEANTQLADAKAEFAQAQTEAEEKLSEAKQQLEDGQNQIDSAKAEIESSASQLAISESELTAKQAEMDSAWASLTAKQEETDAAKTELEQQKAALEAGSITKDETYQEAYQQGYEEALSQAYLTAEGKLDGQAAQIESAIAQLEETIKRLEESGDPGGQLAGLKAELAVQEASLAQINSETFRDTIKAQAKAELDVVFPGQFDEQYRQQALSQVNEYLSQLSAGQTQMDEAKTQLVSGQAQIDAGWVQISQAKTQLQDAQTELAEKEQELAGGWSEYEEGKTEAEEKLADGEEKIQDAEDEVEKIEHAEWYINDRDSAVTDYTGYGDNADRMRAIGEVFPVLFFLVAALVSLTTMTRMVEEQRTLIGTLKALGYERHAIAEKYLGYAFFATVGGCIVGVLIGEKILPYIIITAYGIMYTHMDTVIVPYHFSYAAAASLAALVCTIGATFFSCFRELREQAAELMRPPAPKQGKRVVLERVPFIWKRFSFIWKATVRNLMRYKKRFFMTIFGIGGSMALLLVGFGLQDSIFNIGILQYDKIQLYDGNVILNEDAAEQEKQDIYEALKKDDRTKKTVENLLTQVKVHNGKKQGDVYLNVPEDTDTFSQLVIFEDRVTKERYSLDDESVILTEKMAKTLDVVPGDTIWIQDDIKGEIPVKVKSVCENYMNHYLYMTEALYETVYGKEPDYNAIYYQTQDGTTEQAQKIGEEMLEYPGALSVSYTTDIESRLDDMLSSLDIVIIVLVVSAGMLSFVVLYNLNNINITERKRELATLKVLGFYDNEVSAYVYRENMILTVIGGIFGMLLGKILHQFIIVTVEIESVMFGRNIDISSFIYSFLITLAFSFFVNGVMYFKLRQIDMVESLKSVE